MIGPFSSCEIGKTWCTDKQVNKTKNWKFQYTQPDLDPCHSNGRVLFYTLCGEVLPLQNLKFLRYTKWEKALHKIRKSKKKHFLMAESEQITYHATTSQTEIQNRSQIFVSAPEVPVLRVRKGHFHCFSSLQKKHFRCPKWKSDSKNCSEIRTVTWSII